MQRGLYPEGTKDGPGFGGRGIEISSTDAPSSPSTPTAFVTASRTSGCIISPSVTSLTTPTFNPLYCRPEPLGSRGRGYSRYRVFRVVSGYGLHGHSAVLYRARHGAHWSIDHTPGLTPYRLTLPQDGLSPTSCTRLPGRVWSHRCPLQGRWRTGNRRCPRLRRCWSRWCDTPDSRVEGRA